MKYVLDIILNEIDIWLHFPNFCLAEFISESIHALPIFALLKKYTNHANQELKWLLHYKDGVVNLISGESLKTEFHSCKTSSSSLTELKEWLLSNGITYVVMEVLVFTGNLSAKILKFSV